MQKSKFSVSMVMTKQNGNQIENRLLHSIIEAVSESEAVGVLFINAKKQFPDFNASLQAAVLLDKAVALSQGFVPKNKHEINSGLDRVRSAEQLISQLPSEHEGRNTWLLNYGVGDDAVKLRSINNLNWDSDTMSCEVVTAK